MLNTDLDLTESESMDESSSSPFEGGFTIEFGSTLPTMWYNMPDGLERNPDIVRAEISLLATPMSQAYAAEAYDVVKNVQNVCYADYKSLCAAPDADLAAISNFLDSFMVPRALTEVKFEGKGLKLMNKLRSSYRRLENKPVISKPSVVVPRSGAHVKPSTNLRKVTREVGKPVKSVSRRMEGPRGPPPKGPPPKDGPPPRGPPPRDEPSAAFEAEEDQYQGPPPAPWQDVYYNGALGFGAQGDMCMYENFNQLSQPCVDSMAQLYDVRQRFWHDTQESVHGHGFWVIILAGLVLWMLVKRFMMRKHIQKVRYFLKTINENPALKATIEAETGMAVPDLPCHRHKCSQDGDKKQCCLGRFCKCLCTCIFVFIVSFFMAITSLEITSNIVASWDAEAAANGDEEGTSPVVAIMLLMTITLIEVTIFALAVKAGKMCCKAMCSDSCEGSSCPAPSAPPASPVYVHLPTPPATTPLLTNGVVQQPQPSSTRRFWGRASTSLARMFSASNAHGDYTALSSGDEETEMVTVVPAAATAPQQFVVLSATPVTRVNMV